MEKVQLDNSIYTLVLKVLLFNWAIDKLIRPSPNQLGQESGLSESGVALLEDIGQQASQDGREGRTMTTKRKSYQS